MKRIVRLTESDLTRIVRRVINEQSAFDKMMADQKKLLLAPGGQGLLAFNQIEKSMSGMGTDEEGVKKGVFMIKNVADYNACLKKVKAEGYSTIMKYIHTDMSWGDTYDETQAAPIANWGQQDNNPYLTSFEKHLKQFSSSEKIVY
jgi:hypothetical protein